MPRKFLFAYVCQYCGKPIFFTDIKPKSPAVIKIENLSTADGDKPTVGEKPICPLCKETLSKLYIENIVEN